MMWLFFEILELLGKILFCILESIFRTFVPVAQKSISGQSILITGAGGGLGRKLALEFAKMDVGKIVLWDINKASNDETASQVRAAGKEVHTYVCDVSSSEDVRYVAEQVKTEVGDIDILVNNAGILNGRRLMKLTEKDIQRTMDINATAHFWTTRCFLPEMMDKNSGHILSIASLAGYFGTEFMVDYCASKFAAVGFMEALQCELKCLGMDGVKTTCILPYAIDTGLVWYPTARFPKLHSVLTTDFVAKEAVDALLRNERKVFLPRSFIINTYIACLLPEKVWFPILKDFFKLSIGEHVPQLEK